MESDTDHNGTKTISQCRTGLKLMRQQGITKKLYNTFMWHQLFLLYTTGACYAVVACRYSSIVWLMNAIASLRAAFKTSTNTTCADDERNELRGQILRAVPCYRAVWIRMNLECYAHLRNARSTTNFRGTRTRQPLYLYTAAQEFVRRQSIEDFSTLMVGKRQWN